jgi:hypothetical protein
VFRFLSSDEIGEREERESREIERDRESIESREYVYSDMYIARRGRKRNYFDEKHIRIVQIYINKHRRGIYESLQEILKRDGKSFSSWVLDYAQDYVRLHEPGNPQQRLDTILKLGKAYHAPSPICGFKDCLRDVVAVAVFQKTKETYGLCAVHRKEAEELGPEVWRFMKQC